jgi:quinoprotein glucose dehydrogenase
MLSQISREWAHGALLTILSVLALAVSYAPAAIAWEYWGGDKGGTRFSAIDQITSENVDRLVRAWEFRTGDLVRRDAKALERAKFENTPLFVENSLIMCTPFNEVIALDPGTGTQKWRFDPKLDVTQRPANGYACRGVAYWVDQQASLQAACRSRIFTGTNDMRVIALDAKTGAPCSDFGDGGQVRLDVGMPLDWPGEIHNGSPPVVARGVVIVGSSIADDVRTEAPHGTVHALDARTGQVRWTWDPLIHEGIDAGAANVWGPMSADEELGLVFLPTGSPSPDFWGGRRPGNNEHSNSVVALRAETGELVWAFQTVHHDVWDYDLAAQPTLATIAIEDGRHDVVIQATKQGFLFVLDRSTGRPIWAVEERSVPQQGADGERLSPTQPFPTHVPTLVPQRISADDAFGLDDVFSLIGRETCSHKIAHARNDGLFTPPSTEGTVLFPFSGGGVNWGGVAFDPVHQVLYANTSRVIHIVTLVPEAIVQGIKAPPGVEFGPFGFMPARGLEFGPQRGARFGMTRTVARSPIGALCNPPPWGVLVAVDLKAGKILWQSTVGTAEEKNPLGLPMRWGTPLVNGVLVTGGGLVFTGALDAYLRAFDAKTGAELWQGRLPVPGFANPMTYTWEGEQYIVIGAGGIPPHGGESVVAFRLARANETPSLWSRTIDRPGGRFYASIALIFGVVSVSAGLAVAWRRRAQRLNRTA